jgi:hypothetical protein
VKGLHRGLALALAHVVLASGVAAKYVLDREQYPRVWVETTGFDPDAPIRGRYVLLSLLPESEGLGAGAASVELSVRDGRLIARETRNASGRLHVWRRESRERAVLQPPLPFFLSEHVADPTQRGETLWMEVTVPPHGAPRPLRLGVKRGEEIVPIAP